jgi:hypothetical protein
MRPFLRPLLALALLAAGCASSRTDAPKGDPMERDEIVERDVLVDGVSLLGVWRAVGALDEPDVDNDLRSGMLTETLVINPRGRATLTGEDQRAGTGRVTLDGRISGNRLTFDGLPGAATIDVRSDGRIVVTDPRGRRTVYERE